MDELQAKLENMDITTFNVGTQHSVHVTHIIDPHNFYVRPIEYDKFILKVETTQLQNTPYIANEYDIVMFNMKRSNNDSQYARGRICYKYVEDTSVHYDIFALDYGHFDRKVSEEFIGECCDDIARLPPLALHCRLAHCAPFKGGLWQNESINAFRSLIDDEIATITIIDKTYDKLTVELKNSNPHDIATLLALCHYSTLGYIHNAVSIVPSIVPKKIFYTYKRLDLHASIPVRVQSGKSLDAFYVADINDYRKFMEDYNDISEQAKKEPKLTEENFKVGTPVCIRNDMNKYERAVITEIISDKEAMVKLVDWGKEQEAHILNMRSVSDYCMNIPALAIYCSANERHKLYSNTLQRLLCPGNEFLIEIKQIGEKFESPNIVNIIPLQSLKQLQNI